MTHAFMYGTAVFEGIRGYWNADQGQLYLLKLREHYERIVDSAKVLLMDHGETVDTLMERTLELVRRNGFREDVYVRTTIYKSSESIGVRLHNVECRLNILAVPFGDYIETGGIRCGTVSWRRTSDTSIPSRAKVVGLVRQPGDLQDARRCSTASTRPSCSRRRARCPRGAPRTCSWSDAASSSRRAWTTTSSRASRAPASSSSPSGSWACARVQRAVDRTELYLADEVFLCGTGAQIVAGDLDRPPDGRHGRHRARSRHASWPRYFDIGAWPGAGVSSTG